MNHDQALEKLENLKEIKNQVVIIRDELVNLRNVTEDNELDAYISVVNELSSDWGNFIEDNSLRITIGNLLNDEIDSFEGLDDIINRTISFFTLSFKIKIKKIIKIKVKINLIDLNNIYTIAKAINEIYNNIYLFIKSDEE